MKLARIALPTLIAVVGSGVTIFLFRHDLLFFLQPRTPVELGEAAEALPPAVGNLHVRVRGVADLTSSVRVGRKDGDVRVARLGGQPLLVQVPVPAGSPPGTVPTGEGGLQESGLFEGQGRLWAASDLPGAYQAVLRRFQEGPAVRYLLVADESPSDAWLGFAASLAVGLFGLLTLVFAVRAARRARRASSSDAPAEGADQ